MKTWPPTSSDTQSQPVDHDILGAVYDVLRTIARRPEAENGIAVDQTAIPQLLPTRDGMKEPRQDTSIADAA